MLPCRRPPTACVEGFLGILLARGSVKRHTFTESCLTLCPGRYLEVADRAKWGISVEYGVHSSKVWSAFHRVHSLFSSPVRRLHKYPALSYVLDENHNSLARHGLRPLSSAPARMGPLGTPVALPAIDFAAGAVLQTSSRGRCEDGDGRGNACSSALLRPRRGHGCVGSSNGCGLRRTSGPFSV